MSENLVKIWINKENDIMHAFKPDVFCLNGEHDVATKEKIDIFFKGSEYEVIKKEPVGFVVVKVEDIRELRRRSHGAFNRNFLINEFANKYLDDKVDLEKFNKGE